MRVLSFAKLDKHKQIIFYTMQYVLSHMRELCILLCLLIFAIGRKCRNLKNAEGMRPF